MGMFKKKLKGEIKELLEEYPITRDDDNKLVCNIWWKEAGGHLVVQKLMAHDFLSKIANGSLSSWETITRIRRKLQEELPALRGKKWDSRHNKVNDVVDELHKMAVDYSSPGRY